MPAHGNASSVHSKISVAGLLITLGIIYGDIGTSPLYVLKAIVGAAPINETIVLGALSCIFWTLTMQTTLKYVILTLRADNNGEGGIFALYALVRRSKKKWLILPAIVGGSMLLADGIITPPISVSSAIEGLRVFNPEINTIPIVIGIIAALFLIQQFGTNLVGKFFGPIMMVWFSMLAVLGISQITGNPGVLKALNPWYAYDLLAHNPGSLVLLGAVFLCTTGAEALYSDLGHCGRKNIRISWMFVKVTLVLNYFGQGAWLIAHKGAVMSTFKGENPFYSIMPEWFYGTGIIIATAAAIIASQALISGSFTLINEAIRLNFWPKVRVKYPSELRGQLYIPSVNWMLLIGCICVTLYFKESSNMEAAYGLSIVITMLMTTMLLAFYLTTKRMPTVLIFSVLAVYLSLESMFLIANLGKFMHGGFITLIIAVILISVMWIWYEARKIRNRYVDFTQLNEYLPVLAQLSVDQTVPKYSTHLVYLTSADNKNDIETTILYSILQRKPKRADLYWFVHVHVTDSPYTQQYRVTEMVSQEVYRIDFYLGFRVPARINLLFRHVVTEMVKRNVVNITSRYESLNKQNVTGDFSFVVMEKYLSPDCKLSVYEEVIMDIYYFLKPITLPEASAFGLDTSSVVVEKVPIVIGELREVHLTERIDQNGEHHKHS